MKGIGISKKFSKVFYVLSIIALLSGLMLSAVTTPALAQEQATQEAEETQESEPTPEPQETEIPEDDGEVELEQAGPEPNHANFKEPGISSNCLPDGSTEWFVTNNDNHETITVYSTTLQVSMEIAPKSTSSIGVGPANTAYNEEVSWSVPNGPSGSLFATATEDMCASPGDEDPGWGKSSLSFEGSCQGDCDEVAAQVCNVGDGDMTGPVSYSVYYAASGNPKNGVVVDGGSVGPLASGECALLTYLPSDDGNYMFHAYQEAGHPGQGELWSEECSVSGCSVTPPDPTQALSLTPTCIEADGTHTFLVNNPNAFPVAYSWSVAGTGETGSTDAAPGDSIFTVQAAQPGSTTITWLDELGAQQQTSADQNADLCAPPDPISDLSLSAMCIEDDGTHTFKVNNPNAFPVEFGWQSGADSGVGAAAPGDSYFSVTAAQPGTTSIFWNDEIGAQKSASADQSSELCNPPDPVLNLSLVPTCIEDDGTHTFKVSNPNSFPIAYSWALAGGSEAGNAEAAPGDSYFSVTAGQPGTTTIFWLDEFGAQQQTSAGQSTELCTPLVEIADLQLTSMCTEPGELHKFRVRNSNAFPVAYTWEVTGTNHVDAGIAEPGDSFFHVPAGQPGTTKIYWLDETGAQQSTTKAQNEELCVSTEFTWDLSSDPDSSTCEWNAVEMCTTFVVTLTNIPEGKSAYLQTAFSQIWPDNGDDKVYGGETLSEGVNEVEVCGMWPGIGDGNSVVEIHFGGKLFLKDNETGQYEDISAGNFDAEGVDIFYLPSMKEECQIEADPELALTSDCADYENDLNNWTISNVGPVETTFTWISTTGETGSGTLAAGASTSFTTTRGDGPDTVSVTYGDGFEVSETGMDDETAELLGCTMPAELAWSITAEDDYAYCEWEAINTCATFTVTIENLDEDETAELRTTFAQVQPITTELPTVTVTPLGNGTAEVTVCGEWPGIAYGDHHVEVQYAAELIITDKDGVPQTVNADSIETVKVWYDSETMKEYCEVPELSPMLVLDPYCVESNGEWGMAWLVENHNPIDIDYTWQFREIAAGGAQNAPAGDTANLFYVSPLGTYTVDVTWGDGKLASLEYTINSCEEPEEEPTPVPTPWITPETPEYIPVTGEVDPPPAVDAGILIPVTGADQTASGMGFLQKMLFNLSFVFMGIGLIFTAVTRKFGK